MSARFEPLAKGAALRGVGIGAGDVGDQQTTHRQPLLDVGEVVADRGCDVLLGKQPQHAEARVVVVVACRRTGRKTTCDQMNPAWLAVAHWIVLPLFAEEAQEPVQHLVRRFLIHIMPCWQRLAAYVLRPLPPDRYRIGEPLPNAAALAP